MKANLISMAQSSIKSQKALDNTTRHRQLKLPHPDDVPPPSDEERFRVIMTDLLNVALGKTTPTTANTASAGPSTTVEIVEPDFQLAPEVAPEVGSEVAPEVGAEVAPEFEELEPEEREAEHPRSAAKSGKGKAKSTPRSGKGKAKSTPRSAPALTKTAKPRSTVKSSVKKSSVKKRKSEVELLEMSWGASVCATRLRRRT